MILFRFLAFDFFVGSAWWFGCFIPATAANDLRLRRISLPDLIHYMYFLILILEKEPVFPFSMLSVKPGNCWYHCYNVFGMTRSLIRIEPGTSRTRSQHSTTRLSRRRYWGLNPWPAALDASTLPLGYRGGDTRDWTRDLSHLMPALYH